MAETSRTATAETSPDKHWARPSPPSSQGDTDTTKLYAAVGYALSSWEALEATLCTLFIILTGASELPAVNSTIRRAYGAFGFNSGRRQAVRFAAEVYFGSHWPSAKTELNKLLKHVENASQRRDDMAHGYVAGFKTGETDHGAFLIPPEYNSRMTYAFSQGDRDTFSLARAKYRFTSNDIKRYSDQFDQLRQQILDYAVRMKKKDDGTFSDEAMESLKPRAR